MTQNSNPDAAEVVVSPEVLLVLRRIKRALNEVFCVSLREWKNLCADSETAKQRVLQWLRVAQVYRACRPIAVRGQPKLTGERRSAALEAILDCFQRGPERALEDKPIRSECLAAAQAAISAFKVTPNQIEREELAQAAVRLEDHLDDQEADERDSAASALKPAPSLLRVDARWP